MTELPADGLPGALPDAGELDAFAARADELEARIAEAEARGEPLPPQARSMLASLRELARAVEGLRASMGGARPDDAPPGAPPAGAAPPS